MQKFATRFILIVITLLSAVQLACAAPSSQVDRAVQLIQDKKFDDAVSLLHDLEKSVLNPSQLKSLFTIAYLGQGYQALSNGHLESARKSFRSGKDYNPEDIRLWQGEAMAWYKEGRYAEASALIDQAINYDPQNAELYHLLGRANYAQGRMPEAIDALQRAQSLAGNDEVAIFLQKVRREWQVEVEMDQDFRGHFQLSFIDGGQPSALASEVLEVLEDAYAELGSDLNYYPDISVPVLLYTRNDYSSLTGSPDWSGGLYDGKIRLPVAGVAQMTNQLKALLFHEYMHVLVHFLANRNAPVWLNEGLAEVAGRRVYYPEVVKREALREGTLLDWQELSRPFAELDAEKAPLAYKQSHSIVLYMIDVYGWHKMTELLRLLGKYRGWPDAVSEVYGEFGLDWPAILNEWQTGLN